MEQENKKLLLQDLCSRLPYFLKVNIKGEIQTLDSWADDDGNYFNFLTDGPESNYGEGFTLEDIKPYLRPMSSMTEEEKNEYDSFFNLDYGYMDAGAVFDVADWINAHHFDYRGLIPMGLALEAPEGMYNLNNFDL